MEPDNLNQINALPHQGPLERLEAAARSVVHDGETRTITMYGADVEVSLVDTIDYGGRRYSIPRYATADTRAAHIIHVMGGDAIIQRVVRDQHPDVTTWPVTL